MRGAVIVAMVLAIALSGRCAAEEAPRTFTLAECIRAALADSPDLAAAAADMSAARARLAQARAARMGQIEFSQVVGAVNGARGDPTFSAENRNDYLHDLGPFTRLEFDWRVPLWTFGKLDSAFAAAEGGLRSEAAGGVARRADVVFETRRLYYGLLLSRQLSLVLHDMLDTMDDAVKKSEARLKEKSASVTELDVLKLRIGRARFAKGVFEIDAASDLARSALARAIGLPVGERFEVAERRLEPPRFDPAPLEGYLPEASNRPERKQLEAGLEAQEARVQLEKAGFFPDLFLATGFRYAYADNRERQTNPFAADDFNFWQPVLVAGVHWDLGFLATNARVDEARTGLESLRAKERAAESGLQLEIRKAHGEVVQARATMAAAEDGRKAGRALLVMSVSNFDLGLGDGEELFQNLGAYTEASADHLRAIHDFNVAVGALSKAVGRELTDLEY